MGGHILSSFVKPAFSPLTTKGDLFGFDTVDARIPIGTNDQVLTADSAQDLGLKWATPSGGSGLTFARVVKSADETITEDTVLSDDSELLFTPTINKVYFFTLNLLLSSDSAPDFKCAWAVPTGATITTNASDSLVIRTESETDFNRDWTSAIAILVANTNDKMAGFVGRIVMSSTAGDVNFQWAQQASNVAETKVLEGSCLVVWEE